MAQRTHPFAATVSTKSEVSGHQLARLRPRPRIALAGHSLDLRGGAVRLARDRRQGQAHQRCGDPVCAASRAVFRMPLRQTQGFLTSLKTLPGLTIRVPHHSTPARRAAGLDVPQPIRRVGERAGHIWPSIPPTSRSLARASGRSGCTARTSAPRHGFSDQWRNHGSRGASCTWRSPPQRVRYGGRDTGACPDRERTPRWPGIA